MLHRLTDATRLAFDRWLYRLPDSDPGEVLLHRRRVFIVPTKAGLSFALMLVLLFIASVNYSLSLGFALTFLVAGCAVIDMHLTYRNLAQLVLVAGRARPVFVGEEALFELHLLNRSRHDRYAIWLGFIDADPPGIVEPSDIAAGSRCSITLGTLAEQRGWQSAPQVRLQTRFPLGLLRAWSYWRPDAKVLVYPQPEAEAPPLPLADAAMDGRGQAGDDDFAGVRAYQAGDSMKRLAWRQIARLNDNTGNNLVSKHFEGGSAGDLLLDFARLPRGLDLELRLSRMTRWVLEAEARGLPYGFRLHHHDLPPGLGPAHRDACLRALALCEPIA